ncbi:MAG: adenylosuccinate synthase [Imperialibacter sp.]|uniref:adenylosuccinate synthase n=1 Tax=Imperialibacter sp. TaxID=2038411 RepID=UPI0032EE7769
MAVDVLLGLQWGDEGKGKIVDVLAPKYDVIARFQGGPNAGHTLEFDGIKHVLHQIPSGIFHSSIINIIGNGVVLDPIIFKKEVEALSKYNVDINGRLLISKKASLILPSHSQLDAAYESSKGEKKIGSTLKGIGPTYQDKVARLGLRVGDILSPDFKAKYNALKEQHLKILDFYNYVHDFSEKEEAFFKAVDFLKDCQLIDSEYVINKHINSGAKILAEGAQGSLLDIDFGSYPFVTSSNTTAAGACTGLGIAPGNIGEVYGIFKAYCTRVGSGPFPTELLEETGERLRQVGHEFGATTGRPRRCGWLDLPALKYAIMINKVTSLFMMKGDVLTDFNPLKICTSYSVDGKPTDELPHDLINGNYSPVFSDFSGWNVPINKIKTYDAFPKEVHQYISFIEKEVNVPINLISTGPDRSETVLKDFK